MMCWGLFWHSLHGPLPLTDPFKLLANVSAIALLFGIGVLWANRKKAESELKTQATFYDWFLIWEITAVGVTGLVQNCCVGLECRFLDISCISCISFQS